MQVEGLRERNTLAMLALGLVAADVYSAKRARTLTGGRRFIFSPATLDLVGAN